MTGFGLVWIALGIAIITDAADGITAVATETFGWLVVLEGVIALSFPIGASAPGTRLATVKAIALLLFGLLIVDMPWHNDIAKSLLFGVALATHGLVRIAAATVIRFARWRTAMAGGFLELGLAGLAVMDWPVSCEMTVPLCIAVALILTGWAIVRVAGENGAPARFPPSYPKELALDVALEGVHDTRGGRLRSARLMAHPALWLAMMLRQQAEAMAWPPGPVRDYARALRRIIEPEPRTWGDILSEAIRRYRDFRRRTAFEAKEMPPA